MNVKWLVMVSLLFALSFSAFAQTASDSYILTVRQLPNSEYEAVINYDNSGHCFVIVTPASSVEVIGSNITIQSPEAENPVYCIGPVPPIIEYEETALIGELPPGNYTVTWVQSQAFSLSTQLDADGYSPIPSTSAWALILLILGVLAVALTTLRTRVFSVSQ